MFDVAVQTKLELEDWEALQRHTEYFRPAKLRRHIKGKQDQDRYGDYEIMFGSRRTFYDHKRVDWLDELCWEDMQDTRTHSKGWPYKHDSRVRCVYLMPRSSFILRQVIITKPLAELIAFVDAPGMMWRTGSSGKGWGNTEFRTIPWDALVDAGLAMRLPLVGVCKICGVAIESGDECELCYWADKGWEAQASRLSEFG